MNKDQFLDKKNKEADELANCFVYIIFTLMLVSAIAGGVFTYFNFSKTNVEKEFVTIEKPVYVFAFDTIEIPKGGSLCGTLKMSETEALSFAKKFNYPVRFNDWGEPNVIVQPGEIFLKGWQPDIVRYLEPKKKK